MRTQQISFSVQGLDSARCAVQLEQAVAQLDGVCACYVNYASTRAIVLCDPTRLYVSALVGAVRDAGFEIAPEQESELANTLHQRIDNHHALLVHVKMWLRI